MPKYNRGTSKKLSIRLSPEAKIKIEKAAKNLGVSQSGVILFELTKILEDLPSKDQILEIEKEITLERAHFVATVNEKLMERIDELAEDYEIKKNVLIGYLISERFENMEVEETPDYTDPKKIMIQINESLKKKMMDYAEDNFIPLSGIVSYCILNGPFMGFPSYEDGESIHIFTNVPPYIGEMVKDGAEQLNIREHFYTSLCIYKQFMTPEGRFFSR